MLEDRHLWQVDVFKDSLAGLHTAEVELSHDDEDFTRPTWLGREITAYRQFRNKALAINQSIPALTFELLGDWRTVVEARIPRKALKKAARKAQQPR